MLLRVAKNSSKFLSLLSASHWRLYCQRTSASDDPIHSQGGEQPPLLGDPDCQGAGTTRPRESVAVLRVHRPPDALPLVRSGISSVPAFKGRLKLESVSLCGLSLREALIGRARR